MKTCTIDGCDKTHRAKGLCATHYNQQSPNRHRKTTMTCDHCGNTFTREDRSNRYEGTYCSWACRSVVTWGPLWASKQQVAIYKPAPAYARLLNTIKPERKSSRAWIAGRCKECTQPYLDNQPNTTFCSPRCSRTWHRRAWKVRSNRIVPPATRQAVYIRDDGVCQLCFESVDMTLSGSHKYGPTVDHIVCQSWTQEPDHSALNLRLTHRQCNSARSDEGRYNAAQKALLAPA